MESGQSQYKKSTEQERFAKQLDRDLARKSQRLSQSTIRKLISNDTAQWAKAIYDQKLSQNAATVASIQQSSPMFATNQSGGFGISSTGDTQISNDGYANASSDTVNDELPEGLNKGDILYWDPSAGDNDAGAWVILPAPADNISIIYWNETEWSFLPPPSGSGLKVLTYNNGSLTWTDTEDCS